MSYRNTFRVGLHNWKGNRTKTEFDAYEDLVSLFGFVLVLFLSTLAFENVLVVAQSRCNPVASAFAYQIDCKTVKPLFLWVVSLAIIVLRSDRNENVGLPYLEDLQLR